MRTLALLTALLFAAGAAHAQEAAPLRAVASIKPVHSLAAALMDGVAEPQLLMPGNANPHDYRLRPSEAALLQDADLLFWVGNGFEGGNIDALAQNADIVTLARRHEGESHDDHDDHARHDDHDGHGDHDDHDGHGHDDHDGHDDHAKHDDHDGHDHNGHGHDGHDAHAKHDDHDKAARDLHIWLDPRRAMEIVADMQAALIRRAPHHAAVWEANGAALTARLQRLDERLQHDISRLPRTSYIVFHDAYSRFETRYGLRSAGSLLDASAHGHEHGPSARRLAELRQRIQSAGEPIACVFVEPAFSPAAAETLVQGTEASIIYLDPLGAEIPVGKDAYFTMMENLAAAFADCLAPQ